MNQYHIYDKLGRSRNSTVYKGRKKKGIQYFAIKSVDKTQKQRVLQEVRTMHALDHKNILKFYAWYETTNHLWLILEYCVGGDLVSLMRQDVKLPESSVHDFGRDLVVALQYLHFNSIIYCDLKPSNVLLDENGRLKLGGFGLSRRLSDINKTPFQALSPAKRGTPCYMAPELFSEGATHSTASDLWSLGCVLYECAMGRPPFLNSSFNQLVLEILNNEPEAIPGISPDFTDLLNRLLDKNPATRISWKELVVHPFWQAQLQPMDMPEEPALQAFLTRYELKPDDVRASLGLGRSGADHAKTLRQSVDVTRLSRIALSNLDKEGDGSDYAAAAIPEEEEPQSPAQSDDGSMIDQGEGMGSGVVRASMTGGAMAAAARAQAQGARTVRKDDTTSPNSGNKDAAGEFDDDMEVVGPSIGAGADQGAGSIEALIWHLSDTAVKPIVANRRIERLPEPRFDAKALPFTAMTLEEMLHADQKDLEAFLTHIYRAIASAAPLKDKVNVLSYFETLCVETNSANVLINSSLTILFIRMLRNARAPTLRIRLASVLGLLVRHATFITEELSQTGVVEILVEALKDKNERVRRRVMATLGELLFYIATQQQDGQGGQGGHSVQEASDAWSINSATINSVARLLRPQEDEIAQHYAVKTIENICSQGGDWAARFGNNQDIVFNLVQIFNTSKSENLKATAVSTMARLLRHSPQLVAFVIDKFGVHLLVTGLADASSKVQAACINMLNMALSQSDLSVRAKSTLAEERSLVPSLMTLLDHTLPLLRAKSVVSILLLCRLSTRWLLETCNSKLIPIVERLQRDKDEYLQSAVEALRDEMARFVPAICVQIKDELGAKSSGSSRNRPPNSPTRPVSQQRSALLQFPVVLHLLTSPFFRSSAITHQLITDLAGYLAIATSPAGTSLTAMQDFKATLLHVIEAICQQMEIVLLNHEPMLESLLPALSTVISTPSESGDTRFFCLRMLSEITQFFLLDQELYGNPESASPQERVGVATKGIDRLLRQSVLPLVPRLLKDEDPMPLYALKLLGGLLEVNSQYVHDVEGLGLASQFFEFLSLEHSNNNVHNIRLCRQIIAAGGLTLPELLELRVSEKVSAVLDYATHNNVEPFLEPVLELCHTIVQRDSAEVSAQRSDGALMATLLDLSVTFLELCAHPDAPVSNAAALCVDDMVSVYPQQCAPWLLSPESLSIIISVLNGEHMENTAGAAGAASMVSPQMQQYLLLACSRSLSEPGSVAGPSPELLSLYEAAKQLSASGDADVRTLANQLTRELGPMLH
eukprot:gene14436-20443_t